VFYLTNGYYPPVVRHTCDNIKCINPSHLLGGTHLDNMNDRSKRGRTHNHIPEDQWQEVLRLRKLGLQMKEIASKLNIKLKRVDAILYRDRKSRKDS